jgi:hypothetical protein
MGENECTEPNPESERLGLNVSHTYETRTTSLLQRNLNIILSSLRQRDSTLNCYCYAIIGETDHYLIVVLCIHCIAY